MEPLYLGSETSKGSVQEKLIRFSYLKLLACEYLAATEESSSLWAAIEEINGLIDYLDLCHELSLESEGPEEDLAWLEQSGQEVRRLCEEITSKFQELLNDPPRLDPSLRKHMQEIRLFIVFNSRINSIPVPERKTIFFDLVSEFEQAIINIRIPPLSSLIKEAKGEMESEFGLLPSRLLGMLQDLSFADREVLHSLGIFRIRQEMRHLAFSRNPIPDHLFAQVYCTPRLDELLLCRDLLMNLQRRWGRFIPLQYNHYLIKFYKEPQYWGNGYCFLGDIDQLRLGIAFYRYSMELGENNIFTRMIYRQALDCFHKAKAFLPEALGERLWGI